MIAPDRLNLEQRLRNDLKFVRGFANSTDPKERRLHLIMVLRAVDRFLQGVGEDKKFRKNFHVCQRALQDIQNGNRNAIFEPTKIEVRPPDKLIEHEAKARLISCLLCRRHLFGESWEVAYRTVANDIKFDGLIKSSNSPEQWKQLRNLHKSFQRNPKGSRGYGHRDSPMREIYETSQRSYIGLASRSLSDSEKREYYLSAVRNAMETIGDMHAQKAE